MKKQFFLLMLALMLSLGVAAFAQEDRAAQIDAELQPLLQRQSELYEKVSEAYLPSDEPLEDTTYTPEAVHALGVLTAEEEVQFNSTYAKISALYAGFPAIEQEWADNQEDPAAEARMLEQVDALNQEADTLWAEILPLALRLDTARNRARLLELGLTEAETDTYLKVGDQAYELRVQADQLFEGWGQANQSGRAEIERQSAELHAQADQVLDSIPELNSKVSRLENDRYYAELTALTPEERDELRSLDERILALYDELYQVMDQPNG